MTRLVPFTPENYPIIHQGVALYQGARDEPLERWRLQIRLLDKLESLGAVDATVPKHPAFTPRALAEAATLALEQSEIDLLRQMLLGAGWTMKAKALLLQFFDGLSTAKEL